MAELEALGYRVDEIAQKCRRTLKKIFEMDKYDFVTCALMPGDTIPQLLHELPPTPERFRGILQLLIMVRAHYLTRPADERRNHAVFAVTEDYRWFARILGQDDAKLTLDECST